MVFLRPASEENPAPRPHWFDFSWLTLSNTVYPRGRLFRHAWLMVLHDTASGPYSAPALRGGLPCILRPFLGHGSRVALGTLAEGDE